MIPLGRARRQAVSRSSGRWNVEDVGAVDVFDANPVVFGDRVLRVGMAVDDHGGCCCSHPVAQRVDPDVSGVGVVVDAPRRAVVDEDISRGSESTRVRYSSWFVQDVVVGPQRKCPEAPPCSGVGR